jgi:hypothetical protein
MKKLSSPLSGRMSLARFQGRVEERENIRIASAMIEQGSAQSVVADATG